MAEIRKMELGDLRHVLKIIENHDDDDSEAAEQDYDSRGFDDQYVLEIDNRVIGVTGYRSIEGCDQSFWLSWTYLKPEYRRQGFGKQLVQHVVDTLCEQDGRKLFVKVSDYEDEEEGQIYAAALALYEKLGFELEVKSEDFYDDGEAQLILGFDLIDPDQEQEVMVADEKPCIQFNSLYEIGETEGSYTFGWTVAKKKPLFGKKFFSVNDLQVGLQSTKESGGRAVFITFPSNIPEIHDPLQKAGFDLIGKLKDYYEVGVDELHFVHRLTGIDA